MPRPARPLPLVLALGVLCLVAGWLAIRMLSTPAPDIAGTASAAPATTNPATPPTADDTPPAAARSAISDPSATTTPAPSATTHEAATPEPAATLLWGTVRERDSGAPLPGCSVSVEDLPRTTTDARGRFELRLDDALGISSDLCVVHVTRGEREVLFNGSVVLQPGMEILVAPLVTLRAHVEDPQGRPLRTAGAAAWLPPDHLREVEWFLGSTRTPSDEGRLELEVREPIPVPASVVVQVVLGSSSFQLPCSWAELRSADGATLVLDVCSFRLALTEADGTTPVIGAELRMAAWTDEQSEPTCRVIGYHETAEPLELVLPRGATTIEVAVGVPGFAPRVEQRSAPPCGETWTIALAPLGADDVLEGHVLDVAGRAVAEAWVTCNPATRDAEVGVAAHGGVRTDAEGHFTLPFALGQTAELRAYHKDHGMTPDAEVVGGQRDIVLRFVSVQDVTVRTHLPAGAELARTGHALEWVLALQSGELRSGSERTSPFILEELPPGDHLLYTIAGDGAWFASTTVSVFPGIDASLDIDLGAARHARGRALHADGTPAPGLRVRVTDPTWPDPLVSSWGTTTTDDQGAFDVFVGLAEQPELAILEGVHELLRTNVRTDAPVEIEVP